MATCEPNTANRACTILLTMEFCVCDARDLEFETGRLLYWKSYIAILISPLPHIAAPLSLQSLVDYAIAGISLLSISGLDL
jgi:hypothetical protein